MCDKFNDSMRKLIRARSGLLWVRTNEEKRAEAHIMGLAQALKFKRLFIWRSTVGLIEVKADAKPNDALATLCKNPAYGPLGQQQDGILEYLMDFKDGPAMVIVEDLAAHISENSPNRVQATRLLKDLGRQAQNSRRNEWVQVIVVDKNPATDSFVEVELELPKRDELRKIVEGSVSAEKMAAAKADLEEGDRMDEVLDALVGLESQQAAQALALSLAEDRTLNPSILVRSKKALIQSEALEWIEPVEGGMDAIGGLDMLKMYFQIILTSFRLAQREPNTPRPKGALIAGIPGTGKSLAAKCVGAMWGIPLIRLNVGALFGKFLGESEGKWRQAKAVIEALAPCILWIDEIEKGIQGFGGGASASDGGTTARTGSEFLTWLNECDKPVYKIATANDPLKVPAEFFRSGRFDVRFWVDVPNRPDRMSVMEVVGKKWRSVPADKFVSELELDYDKISSSLANFTGAEIEQAMTDAIMLANFEEREVNTEDVVTAAKMIQPVIKGWEESGTLKQARAWGAKQRAANTLKDPEESGQGMASIGDGDFRSVVMGDSLGDEEDDSGSTAADILGLDIPKGAN